MFTGEIAAGGVFVEVAVAAYALAGSGIRKSLGLRVGHLEHFAPRAVEATAEANVLAEGKTPDRVTSAEQMRRGERIGESRVQRLREGFGAPGSFHGHVEILRVEPEQAVANESAHGESKARELRAGHPGAEQPLEAVVGRRKTRHQKLPIAN